jgi:hypothetical protein
VRDRPLRQSTETTVCGEADFAPSAANQASWKLTGNACIDNYTAATNVTDSERQQRADNRYDTHIDAPMGN